MKFRPLGSSSCSVLGLGTGMLASLAKSLTAAERLRVLEAAAESGINLIDTADSYAQGDCERFLGRALQGRRDRFLLATKAGFRFANLGGLARFLKPLARAAVTRLRGGKSLAVRARQEAVQRTNLRSQEFSSPAIEQCLHASLRRLRTDYVDIFFLHNPTIEATRDALLRETLQRLVREGKARRFGVSSPEPEVLASALEIPGLEVIETPVHPCLTERAAVLIESCVSKKIAVIGNQISASGQLLAPPRAGEDEHASIRPLLQKIAVEKGVTFKHLLLQFALAQAGVTAILTGTTDPAHLRANVADVLAPEEWTPAEIARIREAAWR